MPRAADGERRRSYKRRNPEVGIEAVPPSAAVAVEKYLSDALDALPSSYADRLENIDFVVRREPTRFERARLGLRAGQTLYGLYQGVPLTVRGSGYHLAAPDRITIYWLPLARDFPDNGRLARQVRRTVFHEIAHYFGISDDDLHQIGAY